MQWHELKATLVAKDLLPSLFGYTADELAYSAATSGELLRQLEIPLPDDPPGLSYQPLLYDIYVQDVARLLEKVLTYRNEARELEVRAVKAGADYELFKTTSKIDFEIEKNRLRRSLHEHQGKVHAGAAAAFGNSEPLNSGFARISEGQTEMSKMEVSAIDSEVSWLSERWSALSKYQDEYQIRHSAKGNAHNYEERARIVIEFLVQDLTEAFQKAEAVNVGFETIYGRPPPPLPEKDPLTFIDNLVRWCRLIIREIEFEAERETEYEVVIPIVQPGHLGKKALVEKAAFEKARERTSDGKSPMELEFALGQELFPRSNARVRQVGLSFGAPVKIVTASGNDRNAAAGTYVRLHCEIKTPPQKLAGAGASTSRPPLRLGNVAALSGGGPLASNSGLECRNINPVGKWTLSFDPMIVYKDSLARDLSQKIEENLTIDDFFIHLIVRSKA